MGNCGDILPMLTSIRGLGGKESNVVTCPLGARLPFVQQEETVLPPRAICDTDVFFYDVFARIASEHRHSARRTGAPLAKSCAEPLVGWIRQELGSHSWVFISYTDETVKKALHQRPNILNTHPHNLPRCQTGISAQTSSVRLTAIFKWRKPCVEDAEVKLSLIHI